MRVRRPKDEFLEGNISAESILNKVVISANWKHRKILIDMNFPHQRGMK